MNNQEAINELQSAIDLIKQDGKDWLDERDIPILEMAISALQAQDSPKPIAESVQNVSDSDLISRKAAIDAIVNWAESHHENPDGDDCIMIILDVPPAQPDITDEQAIGHLQASGWMQSHDKQMYEMGLKERLADDSDRYDALLPSSQPEIIRCKDCMHNGSYDTDCPIDWNGKEYCSFAERITDE